MSSDLVVNSVEERFELITRGLQEVIGGDNLKEVMKTRDPEIYWGTAPTGMIHIGYIIPALKIRDLVNANCNVTILLADLHAFFDNITVNVKDKANAFHIISHRTKYYERIIRSILNVLNVDLSRVKFIRGSEYQLNRDVMIDLFGLMSVTNINQAKKAGAEVVKQSDNPLCTGIVYPMLQALDEKYLNADGELGGIDQRKIFSYAHDYLPKVGIQRPFTYLMNPIISLTKKTKENSVQKMSSTDSTSKIDILDPPEKIRNALQKTFCADGVLEDNTALYLIKMYIFPISSQFVLIRSGESIVFDNYDDLETQVGLGSVNNGIHPIDLKTSIAEFFVKFLEPIRNEFQSEENINLLKLAYNV